MRIVYGLMGLDLIKYKESSGKPLGISRADALQKR
jgi:hypothetical protein